MPEVVGDDGVDVGQHQGVVGADHVFRRHAVLVLLDDQVEADATLADANGATFVHPKRGTLGAEGKRQAGLSPGFVARFMPTPGYSFECDLMSLLRAGA